MRKKEPPKQLTPWKKGQSGNPSGKPKGTRGFAARIRKATNDGEDLIKVALGIMNNLESRDSDRMSAVKWLADRMLGKAEENININTDDDKFTELLAELVKTLSEREKQAVYAIARKLDRAAG